MALTNLDKDTTNRLFKMLSLNDNFDLEVIKKNYSSYSKLEILANQINYLQSQAEKIIEDCKLNDHLYNIPMNSKKIPVLHPGPINRGIEISSKIVDEYPNCLINNQVANGIPIRMALLYLLSKYKK